MKANEKIKDMLQIEQNTITFDNLKVLEGKKRMFFVQNAGVSMATVTLGSSFDSVFIGFGESYAFKKNETIKVTFSITNNLLKPVIELPVENTKILAALPDLLLLLTKNPQLTKNALIHYLEELGSIKSDKIF